METQSLTESQVAWALLITCPIDQAYDGLSAALHLPTISEFPRPGETRTWLADDWMKWGSDKGFVLGPKTKHGQMIQHQVFPTICASPASSPGDTKGAMNCGQDARHTLVHFLERAYAVCRLLASDNEVPQGDLCEWLTTKLTGTLGQQLMERSRQTPVAESHEESVEATALLNRLKVFYQSCRQVLIDVGLTEATADKLILLNKGRGDWSFMGLAGQLIPVMKLVLNDHHLEDQRVFAERAAALRVDNLPVIRPSVAEGAEVAPTADQTKAQEQLDVGVTASLNILMMGMHYTKEFMENVAGEMPDFVQSMRKQNDYFYKEIVNRIVEFQVKQNTIIKKAEASALFDHLTQAEKAMKDMRAHASNVQQVVSSQSALIINVGAKLELAEAKAKNQAEQIAKLEDQLTDPQHLHQAKKIKEIRGLFTDDLGFLETANSIQRAKQMLDALIEANEKS